MQRPQARRQRYGTELAIAAIESALSEASRQQPGLAHLAAAGNAPLASIASAGPRRALKRLSQELQECSSDGVRAWSERARIVAILGASPHILPSMRSGIRTWAGFAACAAPHAQAWPPTLDVLLAWSLLFRCKGTFRNYVSFLRTACCITRHPVAVFDAPEISRAMLAIAKRRLFAPREQMFIRRELVAKLVNIKHLCRGFRAMLILAYAFLLRVPSEALPCRISRTPSGDGQGQSWLYVDDKRATLILRRRKNKQGGSVLNRGCWCKQCKVTCPVHRLLELCANLQAGDKVCRGLCAKRALGLLRKSLTDLGVDNAGQYRTHDLRRGHAQDLLQSGAPLAAILAAGEWRSPAFLSYVDQAKWEGEAVLAAHLGESSDEDQ